MTGTSSVTGGITFDGTTSVTGALNVATMAATGVATFGAAVSIDTQTLTLDGSTIEGGVTHVGLETFSGGIALAGTSSITGGITLSGTSSVTGAITFDGVSSFTAALNTATSTATGLSTFSGGVAVAGTSSVTGGITFDGTTSVTGALNVATMSATATGVYTGTGISVSGTVTASGSALTSDRRYKKDIETLEPPSSSSASSMLEELKSVRGVSYTWRQSEFPEKDFDDNVHYGFIAQELEETFPDLVGTDTEGWKAVRYNGMIPILVESLKQAATEIDENVKRIEILEDFILTSSNDRKLLADSKESSSASTQNYTIISLLVTLVILKLIEVMNSFKRKPQTSQNNQQATITTSCEL
ncbi:hypothetical protein TL16_g12255 [Triparma laevis f. inornata]|uniref:Peptidase S74 domain-containing protein n=1 Tax=Triparma laevis f. inornata TaxID=1714386 RepID=A0A9W7BJ34_9STRA|nr:hypothetical protein TL16_g12255 [Triparma laevis f. inornata]